MLAWKMDPWNREMQMGHSNASSSRSIAFVAASSLLLAVSCSGGACASRSCTHLRRASSIAVNERWSSSCAGRWARRAVTPLLWRWRGNLKEGTTVDLLPAGGEGKRKAPALAALPGCPPRRDVVVWKKEGTGTRSLIPSQNVILS